MKLKFDVTGMTCAACSARVENVTKAVAGVLNAEVNLLAGKMTVEAESQAVCEGVLTAVESSGYGICVSGAKREEKYARAHHQFVCIFADFDVFYNGTHGGTSGSRVVPWN